MNRSRKCITNNRKYRRYRGIVGIEAAIVLIAFVIVAAALAFVTLNMGFFTTQKSKEAMSSGLQEASTAIEVDGSVLGKIGGTTVNNVAIPLKTSSGKNPVDLIKVAVSIKTPNNAQVYTVQDIALIVNDNKLYLYIENSWRTFDDQIKIKYWNKSDNKYYYKTIEFNIDDSPFDTFDNVKNAISYTVKNLTTLSQNTNVENISLVTSTGDEILVFDGSGNVNKIGSVMVIPKALFIEYQGDGDTLLEINEKWAVVLDTSSLNLVAYTIFTVEIKPPTGAPLTIERMVPAQLSDEIISLD